MNLRQIEALRAVIETGTVNRAAARLSISQPAVSKLLNNLERASGLALFDRRRGRLSPTPEALLLFEETERVFSGMIRLERFAEGIRHLEHGSLRVGVMPALSTGFVQDIVAGLIEGRARLRIAIHARSTPKIVEWLVGGHLDIGITGHEIDHPELNQLPLCRGRYVCIMPRGHRLAGRKVIDLADFKGERFISFGADSVMRRKTDQMFEQAGVRPTLTLSAPMATTVCALVARGLGVALVDPLYIGEFAPRIEARPFRREIVSEIRLLLPRHRRASLATEAFVKAARDYVAAPALAAPRKRAGAR
ncbi:MAG: LysR family transcriptional regulator, partial [Alphaproteobacteria bacterium]|nr:LysR family transcriptional regulator [Alphaproteobacteria bacterium]